MLENLEYPKALWKHSTIAMKSSNSPLGADNQQERLETIGWIVGFVDGEGCFSVSIIRNTTTKLGWQVFPEFVVTQGAKSASSLRELQQFFRCGNIYENRRNDNHRESLYRYCIRSIEDLYTVIIPFFNAHRLHTAKREDFRKFVKIIKLMKANHHTTLQGIRQIAIIIETMNRKVPSRFRESSETMRQPRR